MRQDIPASMFQVQKKKEVSFKVKIRHFWKHAFTNVRHKYRFSITDENFHEKFAFRLSSLNLWTIVAAGSIIVVAITLVIIIYTPVRQFIPGYVKQELVEQSIRDRIKVDSLQMQVDAHKTMLITLNAVLSGELPQDEGLVIQDSLKDYSNIDYRVSIEDSLLRKEIENSDKYTLDVYSQIDNAPNATRSYFQNLIFYTPVDGAIIREFNYKDKYFGIDIEAPDNTVFKSILDGNIVFSSWSPEEGHMLVVEHEGNLISVYSSCSALFKHPGDFVNAGEGIGIVGTTPQHGDTPHLHLELWYNGTPVDPAQYLAL